MQTINWILYMRKLNNFVFNYLLNIKNLILFEISDDK